MARYGNRAPYAGKGQKALGARIRRLFDLGYKFDPCPQYGSEFHLQPQITSPTGDVIVEADTLGLRRAVTCVEVTLGIGPADNAHLCDAERKPGGPVPHTRCDR